jgi:hypothetical protein
MMRAGVGCVYLCKRVEIFTSRFQRHRLMLFPDPVPAPQSTPPETTDADLDHLVKVGLRLADLLERHVQAAVTIAEAHVASDPVDIFPLQPLPHYPGDIGLTFSRIARAVRLTKALQARLARAPREPSAATRPVAFNAHSRPAPMRDPDGDRIEPPDSVERTDHELCEHLHDPDTDAAILSRPMREIIAIIRHDLGLEDGVQPKLASPSPEPESVRAFRVVRGPFLSPEPPAPPKEKDTTNPTKNTNAPHRPP